MPIFRTKMAGCVAINIFGVDVCSCHKYCLNYTKIAPDAGNVQRSPKIAGPRVNLTSKFNKQLDQINMTLVTRDV
jgi:hypothetical protein